jgi:hypothetical protein
MQGEKLCGHSQDGFALHATPQNDFAGAVKPNHAAAVLTQINAENRDVHGKPLLSANRPLRAQQEGRAIHKGGEKAGCGPFARRAQHEDSCTRRC